MARNRTRNRSKSLQIGLIVGGAAFGAFVFGCVVVVAVVLSDGKSGRIMDREEFKSAVMGKTESEIIEMLGRPDSTREQAPGWTTWEYERKRRDPISGKVESASLWFYGGRVKDVD